MPIEWIQNKIHISAEMINGRCGGTYDEAVLILCNIISGVSSDFWPGENIDRYRFVELLIKYCDNSCNVTLISIPILLQILEEKNDFQNEEMLRTKLDFRKGWHSLVLDGFTFDKYENDIKSLCPDLSSRIIRESSYANLLYKQLRCGYSHLYKPNEKATEHPHTKRDLNVSYVNYANEERQCTIHKIHFHYKWLLSIVNSIMINIEHLWDNVPLSIPNKWWVEGL